MSIISIFKRKCWIPWGFRKQFIVEGLYRFRYLSDVYCILVSAAPCTPVFLKRLRTNTARWSDTGHFLTPWWPPHSTILPPPPSQSLFFLKYKQNMEFRREVWYSSNWNLHCESYVLSFIFNAKHCVVNTLLDFKYFPVDCISQTL
jgi:hypothetical protein